MSKKRPLGGTFKRKVGWPNQVLELEELEEGREYELWSSNTGSKGKFVAVSAPYEKDEKDGDWVLDVDFIHPPGTLFAAEGTRTIELKRYGIVPYEDGSWHRTHYIRRP